MPDLKTLYLTKDNTNTDNVSMTDENVYDADFTKLTFLECNMDVDFDLLDAANRVANSFTRTFRMFIYLDTIHNQVYNENREAVNILSFDDKTIMFTTTKYNAKDKKTIERKYEIDRYTGRVFVTGTIRHKYGKIAGFVHENANLNGSGFCVKNLSGQKF